MTLTISGLMMLFVYVYLRPLLENCLKAKKPNLLIVGEAAHDRGVNNAAEHHGQRVDGQRAIAGLLLHKVT